MEKHYMQASVEEFMVKFGHEAFPTLSKEELNSKLLKDFPEKINTLRFLLIREEFNELKEGVKNNDMVEIADAIGDSLYVVLGTFVSHGLIYEQSETDEYEKMKSDDSFEQSISSLFSSYHDILSILENKENHFSLTLGKLKIYLHGLNSILFLISAYLKLDIFSIFNEIHNSNMSKLGLDGKPIYNEFGKILKGPNFFKPNINKYI